MLTDRNDLDDQLFSTFSMCKDLLRQTPQQAADRDDLEGPRPDAGHCPRQPSVPGQASRSGRGLHRRRAEPSKRAWAICGSRR
nr:hypothetical protein [Bradyrhizobium erythrophlei]